MRAGLEEEPDSLNPVLANLVASNDAFNLIFDGLIRFDENGLAVPDLALRIPSLKNGGISKDGRSVVYNLRRHVRWSDGVPFTAHDVVFTWRSIMNPRNNVPARVGYDQIASISTPNDHTVVLHLKRRYAPFIALFSCAKQGAIVPSHLLERASDLNTTEFNQSPIGTGPYRLRAWRHGDAMEFERNPLSFARPKISRIRFSFFPNQEAMLNALAAGDIDFYSGVPPELVSQARSVKRIRVVSTPSLRWEHLTFNLRPGSGPQANQLIRAAIVSAIDVERIRKTVFLETGGLAPLDQAPDSWARAPQIHYYRYNPARARMLIARAGYVFHSGRAEKGGQPLSLTILSTAGNIQRLRIETVLQSELRAIGIDLSIKNVPANLLLARASDSGPMFAGKFQIVLFAFAPQTSDPNDRNYVSQSAIPPRGLNISGYSNPAVSALAADGEAVYDRMNRARVYARIQAQLIADLPFYTLNWTAQTDAFDTHLRGVHPAPISSDFWNISQWHLTN